MVAAGFPSLRRRRPGHGHGLNARYCRTPTIPNASPWSSLNAIAMPARSVLCNGYPRTARLRPRIGEPVSKVSTEESNRRWRDDLQQYPCQNHVIRRKTRHSRENGNLDAVVSACIEYMKHAPGYGMTFHRRKPVWVCPQDWVGPSDAAGESIHCVRYAPGSVLHECC